MTQLFCDSPHYIHPGKSGTDVADFAAPSHRPPSHNDNIAVRSPPAADEFCRGYPHNLLPTPGYWVECAGQPLDEHVIWDADEGEASEDQDPDLEPPTGKCNQTVQVRRWHGGDAEVWFRLT